MHNEEARTLVSRVFKSIRQAKSTEDIERIVEADPVLKKNKFDPSKYPDLKIHLSTEDIEKLKTTKILSNENQVLPLNESNNPTPLEKLLYSVLWKNGDLGKEKHIIQGVIATEEAEGTNKKNDGLVFYQYGKHLAKREEPIVDQHTIRAFLLFKNIEASDNEITKIRKRATVKNDDISNFKKWISSAHVGGVDKQFYVDKVLFSLGKSVKLSSKKK